MKCNNCSKPIYEQDNMNRSICSKQYHFNSVGIQEDRFRRMRSSTKTNWNGPCCVNSSLKSSDTINLYINKNCNALEREVNKQLISTHVTVNTSVKPSASPVSDAKPLDVTGLYNFIKIEMNSLREGNRYDLQRFK